MKTILLASLCFAQLCSAQLKELSVTIDDLPVAGAQAPDAQFRQHVTTKLLDALTTHRVPAIGFVIGQKLLSNNAIDSARIGLLQQWLDAGMELGNHTYAHNDYNDVSFSAMADDVVKGEPVLRALLHARGKELRYYRQPYLHRGPTKEKADSLQAFLKERGYIEAPVTIDNGEWIFASAYYKAFAAGDSAHMKELGAAYVAYMEKKLDYYEMQSMRLFGRAMKQTLLFHANLLNADTFDMLARMIERHSYRFVTLAEALTDPAYASTDTFYRKGGISWLDRWALSQGKRGEYFKDDPHVPDDVMKFAGVDGE